MAITRALFAGDDSTPDSVKRRMMLADLLRQQGADVSKVDSPLEAIGSILQSGAAYWNDRRAQEDQAAGLKTRAEGWQKLASSYMGNGGAGVATGADGGSDLGGSAIAPSGAAANLKPADREGYVMSYLTGKGLAPHQAAGFVGNLIQESSLNTGANNPGDGADGSDSIGIGQWNGDRARNLRAFAKGTGREVGDIDTQLDFALHEMGLGNAELRNLPGWGAEGRAGQALKSAQDVQSAAAAGISYERPSGWSQANPTAGHGWDNRFGHAQRLAGMNWSGQQVASTAPTAAPASQQPVQVASLDPSAGMAQAMGAPRTARSIVEDAAARQQAGTPPEMGAQDVAAIQARPKDPHAVPYSGPGATIDPSQAAALTQGGGAPAAPVPQTSAPVSAPTAQNRQLGALLLAGSPQVPVSGVNEALVAQLMGNAWTEDIGQQAFQMMLEDRQRLTQYGYRQQELQQSRAYEEQKAARDRAAGNEDYLTRKRIDQQFQKPEGVDWQELPNGDYGYFDPKTREFTKLGSAPKADNGGISIGADGSVQIGGGVKMPAGFMPDPNNPGAVTPIPGGPAEQLPAELAGRIAIADSFLGQAGSLREKLAAGAATGLWDRFQAGNNSSSEQAGIYRQLQSGADALQRLLTGAGMTESEAAAYAGRYLPTYSDNAESAVSKLDQMTREVQNARAAALRGRGGINANATPNGSPTGQGPAVDYRTKYGLE